MRIDKWIENETLPIDGKRESLRRLYSAFCQTLLASERGVWTLKAFAEELRKRGYPVGAIDGGGKVYVGNIELLDDSVFIEAANMLQKVAF